MTQRLMLGKTGVELISKATHDFNASSTLNLKVNGSLLVSSAIFRDKPRGWVGRDSRSRDSRLKVKLSRSSEQFTFFCDAGYLIPCMSTYHLWHRHNVNVLTALSCRDRHFCACEQVEITPSFLLRIFLRYLRFTMKMK